jgi:hypothetical protein
LVPSPSNPHLRFNEHPFFHSPFHNLRPQAHPLSHGTKRLFITFKFDPIWIQHQKEWEIILDEWFVLILVSPFYVWKQKIKSIKEGLKCWTHSILPSHLKEMLECVESLSSIPLSMKRKPISLAASNMEEVDQALYKVQREEETYWRLKSRSL